MDLKDIKTSKIELQEYLLLIAKVPEKINKIDIDIRKELLIDIDNRINQISNTIYGLITNSTEKNYPKNIAPDKLFEYWTLKVSQLFTYSELKSLKILIENSFENKKVFIEKDFKSEVWFIVGLMIATNEIEKHLQNFGNPTKIAKELYPKQWSSFKTYIGDSKRIDNVIKRNTNIFNSKEKVIIIYNHCKANNLKMSNVFEDFYKTIEAK